MFIRVHDSLCFNSERVAFAGRIVAGYGDVLIATVNSNSCFDDIIPSYISLAVFDFHPNFNSNSVSYV